MTNKNFQENQQQEKKEFRVYVLSDGLWTAIAEKMYTVQEAYDAVLHYTMNDPARREFRMFKSHNKFLPQNHE